VYGASLHIGLVDTFIATGRPEEAGKILSVELGADPSASYRQELIRRVNSLKADQKLAK